MKHAAMPFTRYHLEAFNRSFAEADGRAPGQGAGANYTNSSGLHGVEAQLKKSPSLVSIPSTNESIIYGTWGEREFPSESIEVSLKKAQLTDNMQSPKQSPEGSLKKIHVTDDLCGYSTDSLEILPWDVQISAPQTHSWYSEMSSRTPTEPHSYEQGSHTYEQEWSDDGCTGANCAMHSKGTVKFLPFAPSDFSDAPLSRRTSIHSASTATNFTAPTPAPGPPPADRAADRAAVPEGFPGQQHYHPRQAPPPLLINPPAPAGCAGGHLFCPTSGAQRAVGTAAPAERQQHPPPPPPLFGARAAPPPQAQAQAQAEKRVQGRGRNSDGGLAGKAHKGAHAQDASSSPETTVVLQGMPYSYSRDMVLELLDQASLLNWVDFVYVPSKFETGTSFGYAFVNFLTPAHVAECKRRLNGFSAWKTPSNGKVCEVSLAEVHGRNQNIERYRNSPVMHPVVPDELKPIILCAGRRLRFPPPTKGIKAPRIRKD